MAIPSVMIIWDYDTAIGQVNASYPYNFHEEVLREEIDNVERLLEMAAAHETRMTFAVVGFAAEPGQYPYHVPDQLRRIHAAHHEIASHSWRHEWFPFLQAEQVRRSLARSKQAIESCIGSEGAVRGFVPPFSRPMTWYRKGAISLGDRSLNPWRPGADIGSLCKVVQSTGYAWCRVSYRSLAQRFMGADRPALIHGPLETSGGIKCVPYHYTGFDAPAIELLERAAAAGRSVVFIGHPSGLTRVKAESFTQFAPFLDRLAALEAAGRVKSRTVTEHLSLERTLA